MRHPMDNYKNINPFDYAYFPKNIDLDNEAVDVLKCSSLIDVSSVRVLMMHLSDGRIIYRHHSNCGVFAICKFDDEDGAEVKEMIECSENVYMSPNQIVHEFINNIALDMCIFYDNGVYVCLCRTDKDVLRACFLMSDKKLNSAISILSNLKTLSDFETLFDHIIECNDFENTSFLFPKYEISNFEVKDTRETAEPDEKENMGNMQKGLYSKNRSLIDENHLTSEKKYNFKENIQNLNIKFKGIKITTKKDFIFSSIADKLRRMFVRSPDVYEFTVNRGNLREDEILFEISEVKDSLFNVFKGCKKYIESADFIEGKGNYKDIMFIISRKYGLTGFVQIVGSEIDAELIIEYLRMIK